MIIVSGAKGVVGKPLCDKLTRLDLAHKMISRRAPVDRDWIQWNFDAEAGNDIKAALKEADCLMHCAPIWFLAKHIEAIAESGIKRIIVFSSTSVISKQNSPDPKEERLVKQLADAENKLIEFSEQHNLNLTILRPSMIYGYGLDQNVSHIANKIKRLKFMLIAGNAIGKRQPVHADDLVDACLKIKELPISYGQQYNLAGAEVLSYKAMVQRIFIGLGQKEMIISVPIILLRIGLTVLSKIGSFDYTPEMANRMNQDLVYDYQKAADDFSYVPKRFLSDPKRDLP